MTCQFTRRILAYGGEGRRNEEAMTVLPCALRVKRWPGTPGLVHRLETLFSRVRQGVLLLDANVAGVVQQVLDASEDCVTGLGENRPNPGFGTALQAIERLLGIEPEEAD